MKAALPQSDPRSLFSPVLDLLQGGCVGAAIDQLSDLEAAYADDPIILQHVGEHLMLVQQNSAAVRAYRRAASLAPHGPQVLYNLATALIAVGDLDEAESLLDRVILLNVHDYDAWQNRSTLRRQTPERNHVAALEAMIEMAPRGEVQLGYALAKELEDLGEWERSFAYLKRGADRRRRGLSYQVQADIDTMAEIARVFDAGYLKDPRPGYDGAAPIVVMGLPRSGTTLIDRILSSHDAVQSLGEINDFALSLMRLAKAAEGGKSGLIRAAQNVDPQALGRAYIDSATGYGVSRSYFIDKTPANYLYLGLILKALPKARIVHLRRHPMDNGYALYKTLFRMGCPYSYDLHDIGRYMLAYEALMKHWRTIAPGRIIDIDYESVVSDTEAQTRHLLSSLSLDWQDACLSFHENRTAAATASAAQVRQPVYKTSVNLWRRYENDLAPLADILNAGGLI